jgi:predicted ester cyclase
MSTEENKALARRWWEMEDYRGIKADEIEETTKRAIGEIFAPDFVAHAPEGDMPYEAFVQFNIAFLTAFPDANFTIEEMIAEGDMVALLYKSSGTHQGTFMGIPATGKKIESSGMVMGRIAGGKFVEGWRYSDTLGTMKQLGAMPSR